MKKILVVDDEQDILHILKSFLKRKNYEVAVSLSCEHGMDTFYAFQPHVVILDVNVGTSDGRHMCRTIKSQAEYQHIPVILISADVNNFKSYTDYGATSIMEKPFDFSRLVTLLEQIIKP